MKLVYYVTPTTAQHELATPVPIHCSHRQCKSAAASSSWHQQMNVASQDERTYVWPLVLARRRRCTLFGIRLPSARGRRAHLPQRVV